MPTTKGFKLRDPQCVVTFRFTKASATFYDLELALVRLLHIRLKAAGSSKVHARIRPSRRP